MDNQHDNRSRLIEVYRAKDIAEAHAISGMLSESQIANRIDGDALQMIVGEVPPGWQSAPRIMVLEPKVPAARAIVEEWERRRREK